MYEQVEEVGVEVGADVIVLETDELVEDTSVLVLEVLLVVETDVEDVDEDAAEVLVLETVELVTVPAAATVFKIPLT